MPDMTHPGRPSNRPGWNPGRDDLPRRGWRGHHGMDQLTRTTYQVLKRSRRCQLVDHSRTGWGFCMDVEWWRIEEIMGSIGCGVMDAIAP